MEGWMDERIKYGTIWQNPFAANPYCPFMRTTQNMQEIWVYLSLCPGSGARPKTGLLYEWAVVSAYNSYPSSFKPIHHFHTSLSSQHSKL
jgi:hypothetical protein